MNEDGEKFLASLGSHPAGSFERNFSRISTRFGLGCALGQCDLELLYQAAYAAALCIIAINGLDRFDRRIDPWDEANRRKLESRYMAARDRLHASVGWRNLPQQQKRMVQRVFLNVSVNEDLMPE